MTVWQVTSRAVRPASSSSGVNFEGKLSDRHHPHVHPESIVVRQHQRVTLPRVHIGHVIHHCLDDAAVSSEGQCHGHATLQGGLLPRPVAVGEPGSTCRIARLQPQIEPGDELLVAQAAAAADLDRLSVHSRRSGMAGLRRGRIGRGEHERPLDHSGADGKATRTRLH